MDVFTASPEGRYRATSAPPQVKAMLVYGLFRIEHKRVPGLRPRPGAQLESSPTVLTASLTPDSIQQVNPAVPSRLPLVVIVSGSPGQTGFA